jgi:hypothetical protein
MSRIAKAAQIASTTCALVLFVAPAAFSAQVITHVPTPEIHVPPPQIHVPTPQTPDASTRLRQIEDSGAAGGSDTRAKKGPADKPDPAIAKYRLRPLPDTSVGAIYQAILDGGDNAAFAAVFAAYEAAITAAEQALALAAQCAMDPSLPGCASAESVPQAQQNLSDAQNALATQGADFYADMNYFMWILAFVETAPTSGDSEAEMTAIEVAIQECLASPSTCDAIITQLNALLAELGVPTTVTLETMQGPSPEGVLLTPEEAAEAFPFYEAGDTLSELLGLWSQDWYEFRL